MSLPNDLLELFTSESNKLENLVNALNFDAELPVNQIVEVYYQITNLSSMITVVKPQLDQNNDKVLSTEKFISEKFNSTIHPKIMERIATLISDIKVLLIPFTILLSNPILISPFTSKDNLSLLFLIFKYSIYK